MRRLTFVCGPGFNFFAHGSLDLYPTFLQMTKGFDSYYSTVATIISNCGAVTYAFYSSELAPFIAYSCLLFRLPFLFCVKWWHNCGHRVTVYWSPSYHHHLCCVRWRIHPALDLAQHIQCTFCWRVLVTIWLVGRMGCHPDLSCRDSPPGFRATFPGVTYQLGNVRPLIRGSLLDLDSSYLM